MVTVRVRWVMAGLGYFIKEAASARERRRADMFLVNRRFLICTRLVDLPAYWIE